MSFKKWMNKDLNSRHIGKVAVFYIPVHKLSKKIRKEIHNFFMNNYYAYTHEVSGIQGFWSSDKKIVKDKHERYEVSFKGEKNLKKFVSFLSNICSSIKEKSIYLTVGGESYLIGPR